MAWELFLPEDDYRFFKENISLLEEQVLRRFTHLCSDPGIVSAIRKVPRHLFVNEGYKSLAYTDNALPTRSGLTTSAPSVIAEIIYHVGVERGDRLLEVGTGTGYEAAVLAEMGVKVFSIEIDRYLAHRAKQILVALGYKSPDDKIDSRRDNEMTRHRDFKNSFPNRRQVALYRGNGREGLPQHAPFQGIIIAASIPGLKHVSALWKQLSPKKGRLVVPVGERHEQVLYVVERTRSRMTVSTLDGFTFDFVRMVLPES